MSETSTLRGVLAPVVTPFKEDLSPDGERLVGQCRWLLQNGVGLAVFGTNSEANSMSVEEKKGLLSQIVDTGIPPSRMMPGTGTSAIPDTVALTRHAVSLGSAGVLMLPPFYYKGVSDEGLFRSFSEVIERVGDDRLRVYLYNIPPMSQVPISLGLIERLLEAYPGIIAGVKDSSGEWNNTKAMLDRFQPHGFDVFAGSETFLLETLRAGGAGCISATANVNPGAISNLADNWDGPGAEEAQTALDTVRGVFQKYPMIPAMKAAIAAGHADSDWARVRPPLVELTAAEASGLVADLDAIGFALPGTD